MKHYRHFRNTDPPHLANIWHECFPNRGAYQSKVLIPFDACVFSKPYFDPAGLIIADSENGPIAFAHAGFGPNMENTALDYQIGVTCIIAVKPAYRRRKIGTELLQQCEDYMIQRGAKEIYAGPVRPIKPFYTGLYGGSNAPGFLKSDPDAEPFLLANNYRVVEKTQVLQRRLEGPINIVDSRFSAVRRRYEIQMQPQARVGSWWRECVLGVLDPSEYRLDDRQTGQTAARALFWEMKGFGWRWGTPAAGIIDVQVRHELRRIGLGKYLICQLLRHLQEQYYGVVEVQTPERNEGASELFRSMGFEEVDMGQCFQRTGPIP